MLIGYKGRAPRTKQVAGEACTFALDKQGRLVCDVQTDAAIAVLLHQRNSNLFYAIDAPAPLTRGMQDAPPPPASKAVPPPPPGASPHAETAKSILDNNVETVLGLLQAITDPELRGELLAQESAREGGGRKTIIAKLSA